MAPVPGETDYDIMSKPSASPASPTRGTPVQKPAKGGKSAASPFPLDTPKKAAPPKAPKASPKLESTAALPPAPVVAAEKKAPAPAPKPPTVKVLSPAHPGAEKEAGAMLAALGMPSKDPRVSFHGQTIKGRLFVQGGKRGAWTVDPVAGPARTAYLVRLPDRQPALAAGYVSIFWGDAVVPLNAALLNMSIEARIGAPKGYSYDVTLSELGALLAD